MKGSEHCLPNIPRWNNYTTYRFIMWAWMMNELAVVFATVEISHNGFYLHAFVYSLAAIFIGIPLVYSEICIAQYSNCNVVTMWDFLPILKGVGWASVYVILLKTIYILVISSWYLIFIFYTAVNPPPWFTCENLNDPMCIVKSVNISQFQHCIEAQILFNEDCGLKTASKCFFDKEIGTKNTLLSTCFTLWKSYIATIVSAIIIFVLFIQRVKIIHIVVRFLAVYVCVIIFVLLCVALSGNGSWFPNQINIDIEDFEYTDYLEMVRIGFLSCGTGYGIIGYLSQNVSFRSPATMTSIAVTLYSTFFSVMLSLIIYGGIKIMSYFHGEEESIIEIGDYFLFKPLASVAEILSYFDELPLWTFLWFLTMYLFLLMNLWILYSFIADNVLLISKMAHKYYKVTCFVILFCICILCHPFFCSDLITALSDVMEILQLTNSLFYSVSIYWIYGFRNHNVDITFMIGIKASYFWKIAWISNPVLISINIYVKWSNLNIFLYEPPSSKIIFFNVKYSIVLFYVLIYVYFFIILIGVVTQFRHFFIYDKVQNVFSPQSNWGPQDSVLYISRKMFVPEIMTREFLYRQVKIHGYSKKNKTDLRKRAKCVSEELSTEWNVLSSN